jgi:hypothetical protein
MTAMDSSSSINAGKITSLDELMKTPEGEYQRWITEIQYSDKELYKFHERGRKVVRRYLDERDALESTEKKFNIFYSNVNILRSALYSRTPRPDVSRRWKDYKDEVARVAGIMLQRAISTDLDDPNDNFDAVMRESVEDRLIPGMAVAWLRLDTQAVEKTLPADPDSQLEEVKYKEITGQKVIVEHVNWEDFLYSPCRIWDERRWVGRRVYMDRDDLVKRFGEEVGKAIPLDYYPQGSQITDSNSPKNQALEKAVIYEIWDRTKREVYWLSKAYPKLLDKRPDPLGLQGFEPCPRPMFANLTTSNCVPRPDHYFIQDQYNELDKVNDRIDRLTDACKAVGVYDQAADGVQRLLQEGVDNVLIPVSNWAQFAESGGIDGATSWLPLDQVITALQRLREAREDIKQQIYELTGIADIVRGATKASETLGAQEIKAKFASIRIQELQSEVARFAAEILRIKAEIMALHFTPDLFIKASGIEYTDDAQLAAPALALIQNPQEFEWRIEITSDSLAQIDYSQEKMERTEFLTAVSQYMEKGIMMIQAAPNLTPMFFSLLKFGVAGFRGAKEIEGMMDRELDAAIAKQQQAEMQPPPPSPEEQKVQADIQGKQAELGMKQESHDMDMAFKMQENQLDRQTKLEQSQLDRQVNQQKAATQIEMDNIKVMQQLANPPATQPQGGGRGPRRAQ